MAESSQSVDLKENQLQVTPAESATKNESNSMTIPMDEIPYEDRPIPEAYFPPEDEEPAQEFMPEPNIQQTPTPSYKKFSNKELDAIKYEVKEKPVSPKEIDFSALMFDVKPSETKSADITQNAESKDNAVATKTVEIPNIKIDIDKLISNKESAKPVADSSVVSPLKIGSDSLIAKTDSLSTDSLAKDSVALIPVAQPKPKREIISIDGKELPDTINNTWWFPPVLILLFLAYTVIIRDRKKAIFSEMQTFVKPTTDGSIFGIQWLQNSKYKFFLSLLGVVSVSLYLFLANTMSISSIWIFFLAVAVFVIGKNLMLSLLEYIYFQGANVSSMSEAFMVMVRQAGLMITPAVLGLCFAPEQYRTFFIYFGGIIVGIAILAFNIKLILNFLRGITSIFYLILYLCTLEVIPVAIFFVLGLLPRV